MDHIENQKKKIAISQKTYLEITRLLLKTQVIVNSQTPSGHSLSYKSDMGIIFCFQDLSHIFWLKPAHFRQNAR